MNDHSLKEPRRAFLGQLAGVAMAAAYGPSALWADEGQTLQERANKFLRDYESTWLPLEYEANQAAWQSLTNVKPENTEVQVKAVRALKEAIGAPEIIKTAKELLAEKAKLDELTVRQLEKLLLKAAEFPGTIPDVVKARVEAEAKQSEIQDGFEYQDPKSSKKLSANDIDRIMGESRDLDERKAAWELSKTIGGPLRDGLLKLRDLRNRVAKELGYDDFFALQVADYGMTVPQMTELTESLVQSVMPLYRDLHAWAKHELAKRYKADVPDGKIPAHWLPNRWAQDWPGLVEGVDLDQPFKSKTKEYIVEQAERFYTSLGFPALPKSFYEKSDLYPAEANSGRRKNSHASAWHVDLKNDVRSLMSVESNHRWFETSHHELGHIYYYISYSTPKIPYLLREGANRAFHEGVGDLIGLAAGQKSYMKSMGLMTEEADKADSVLWQLQSAIDSSSIVFLPWSAGVMTEFERKFYQGKIADNQLNAAWWEIVGRFQGVESPGPRPETGLCDAATKTHINDDPAQYYDYAIGTVIKFQLHEHIAREILKQDPRDCNYYGNAKVGKFLKDLLSLGASRDWNTVLKEATGQTLSAEPMVRYFEPLSQWLKKQNQGRKIGW